MQTKSIILILVSRQFKSLQAVRNLLQAKPWGVRKALRLGTQLFLRHCRSFAALAIVICSSFFLCASVQAASSRDALAFAIFTNPNPPDQGLKDKSIELKKAMRSDKRFLVMLCSQDDPTFMRASVESSPHVDIKGALSANAREVLTGAAGGAAYVTISRSSESSMLFVLNLVWLKSPERVAWSWTGADMQIASKVLAPVMLEKNLTSTPASLNTKNPPSVNSSSQEPAPKAKPDSTPIHVTDVAAPLSHEDAGTDQALINSEIADDEANGETLAGQDDYLSAVAQIRQAVYLSPKSIKLRLNLAQLYLTSGNPAQAVDESRRALLIDPKNADVAEFLKKLSDSGADMSGSALDLLLAAGKDPDNPVTWITLGDSYSKQKLYSKAIESYRKAALLHPADTAPQIGIMAANLALGDYGKAASACNLAGEEGYKSALQIISSNADNLVSVVHRAMSDLDKGTIDREESYRAVVNADEKAEGLSGFVKLITAPSNQKTGYLHLSLGVQLLSQSISSWRDFEETNSEDSRNQAQEIEKNVVVELKSAMLAESLSGSTASKSDP